MTLITYLLSKLRNTKDVVRQMSKMPRFITPFDSQHTKVFQILVKSAWQYFHHIFHHYGELENVSLSDM